MSVLPISNNLAVSVSTPVRAAAIDSPALSADSVALDPSTQQRATVLQLLGSGSTASTANPALMIAASLEAMEAAMQQILATLMKSRDVTAAQASSAYQASQQTSKTQTQDLTA